MLLLFDSKNSIFLNLIIDIQIFYLLVFWMDTLKYTRISQHIFQQQQQ